MTFCYREAQSGSARGASRVPTPKAVEDLRQIFRRDTAAAVFDGDDPAPSDKLSQVWKAVTCPTVDQVASGEVVGNVFHELPKSVTVGTAPAGRTAEVCA